MRAEEGQDPALGGGKPEDQKTPLPATATNTSWSTQPGQLENPFFPLQAPCRVQSTMPLLSGTEQKNSTHGWSSGL